MFGAIVVLWLGSEPELAAHRADLAAWTSQRRLQAQPLRALGTSYDATLAEQVESLLEEARATPAADGAPSALERAEALLLEHPELPQAAWLLAERYAIEAHAGAARGEAVAARGRELLDRARRLEGPRAWPVGPVPLPDVPAPPSPAGEAPEPSGTRPLDRVFIDGVAAVASTPGRHHVSLVRAGLPVWAGWVPLEAGRTWSVPDPTVACSAHDLAGVTAGAAAPEPAPGVRCERWAVARSSLLDGIDIAECAASRCAGWRVVSSERGLAVTRPAPSPVADLDEWPRWATWTLIGAGAVAATGVVLWQAGVFDRSEPGTEFVFTGPSAPAYRF